MKSDHTSPLAKLITKIEVANQCTAKGREQQPCGQVYITKGLMTTYAHGGWMSAGASYRFFIGFMESGTGLFYQANYVFEISEDVEAQENNGDGAVKFLTMY